MVAIGARGLPKYLTRAVGKERIIEAIKSADPTPVEKLPTGRPKKRVDYHEHSYPHTKSKDLCRQRWRAKRDGDLPPDQLYSLDEALSKAGLA
jgi:hypothetical protein